MHIAHVVGARPNFMKAAPVLAAFEQYDGIQQTLIHTGQHYDRNMSDLFFEQLSLPRPDFSLGVGSGSHAVQTANIMVKLEDVVIQTRPDMVMVYGDVNSTVAAAMVCSKLGIQIGHVEAGLRSFDRTMPEELNRIVTDQLSDMHFTPSADGDANLLREGVASNRIHLVGNVMIDTLVRLLPHATMPSIEGLPDGDEYALATLHRPANVDDRTSVYDLLSALNDIARRIPIVFSIHPRTRQRFEEFASLHGNNGRIHFIDPQGYLEFLALQRNARLVITDSGGIQEETTYLGVPCLTLRENTERPVTVDVGTNTLIGRDLDLLRQKTTEILDGGSISSAIPEFWDGHAAERIAAVVTSSESRSSSAAA